VKRALVLVLLPALAGAQPAVRYNDPPPSTVRSPLVVRIDEMVARVAKKARRPEPKPDARLDAAATDIARSVTAGEPAPNELVEGALWVHGIVEPPPNVTLASMSKGGEDDLVSDLAGNVATAVAQGRYSRVGVGLVPLPNGDTHVVLLLQESFVDLEPISRAQPLGGHVLVRGKLHDGFSRPEAFVTEPDGTVLNRIQLGGDPVRFGGTFRCGPQKGRYQVEVAGEDRFGPTVVANFPVWCGAEPPSTARAAAPSRSANDEAFTTPAAAERSALKLLNADRARAHLPPLAWDDALAAVARAHSSDMRDHHFFGHISPQTGNTVDRVRKARLETLMVLENVARAFTPGEAQRGLMNSPGHRANILNKEVTHVGIGVVQDPSDNELLVTQLFSRPAETFGAHTADELRRAIADTRRARRLPALERDAGLDAIAQSIAVSQATSGLSSTEAGRRIDAALQEQPERWRTGHSILAVTSAVSQLMGSIGNSVADRESTHVGVGVAPGKPKDGGAGLYVVIVLATHR
jgi:uncharacterized protein YkwD